MPRPVSTNGGPGARPSAIIFDLFQTLVFFDASKLPVVAVGSKKRPATIVDLQERLERLDPAMRARDFLTTIDSLSREISAEKRATGREISSNERFRRALRAATQGSPTAALEELDAVADGLVDAHMGSLSRAVYCPDDRHELLSSLGSRYRIGLLSNFDHGPTAHRVLERLELARWFATRVVSDDVGVCKPAAEIFHLTCERMGVAPDDAVYVGDSMEADIEGAAEAGLRSIWVGKPDCDRGRAVAVVQDVTELPAVLKALGWD